jgi:hypothetical protein
MLTATEDSIRSLSDANSEILVNTLASAKLALEPLYESGKGQFPREEALDDLMNIVEISKRIEATNNIRDKINILSEEYQTFSKQLRSKYRDLLPTKLIRKLEAFDRFFEGFEELMIAQTCMVLGLDEKEQVDQVGKIYTGMVKLSEVIEQYIRYFPDWLIEIVKKIPLAILADPDLQPNQSSISQEVVNYLTALKHTSKGVLWEIDNYTKEKKHTVGELLNWLETAPGWAGDDFEECLEYVNRTRK